MGSTTAPLIALRGENVRALALVSLEVVRQDEALPGHFKQLA
jgi:hypothetical protein